MAVTVRFLILAGNWVLTVGPNPAGPNCPTQVAQGGYVTTTAKKLSFLGRYSSFLRQSPNQMNHHVGWSQTYIVVQLVWRLSKK